MNASRLKIPLAPLRFLFAHFHYHYSYYLFLFFKLSCVLRSPLASCLIKTFCQLLSFRALSPLLICCHSYMRRILGLGVVCAEIYSALHDNEQVGNLIRSKCWASGPLMCAIAWAVRLVLLPCLFMQFVVRCYFFGRCQKMFN